MCLYPRIIKNKKYTVTKKNNGNIPINNDTRTLYIPVGCGNCIECRKKKANNWKVRLSEEIRNNKTGKFVTLTFSDESLAKLRTKINEEIGNIDNQITTYAVRKYLERWRKKYKVSVRHWLVTELGHKNTERIHLHGIIWTDNIEDIKKIWQYGWVYIGQFVNEKTINYIVKYVTKTDKDHQWYDSIILTSPGIGNNYTQRPVSEYNKYKKNETIEEYRDKSGRKTALPIYYRNKIYTEEERELLWIEKLNKKERYVMGQKIDVSTKKGVEQYERALKTAQSKNERLGYRGAQWSYEEYKKQCKIIDELSSEFENN